MKKIESLHLEALKEKLFIAYILFVTEALEKMPAVGQQFPLLAKNLLAAYRRLDKVYMKYDIEFCTQRVREADAARNLAYRKLRDTMKMFVAFPETEEKTAAARIVLEIARIYGGGRLPKQGMMAKTTSVVNLVEDLEQKYAAEVATLGAGSLVAALKEAQAEFEARIMERAECESVLAKGAMVEARRRATEAYRDFVTTVNIAAKSDDAGALTEFIKLMNVEIAKFRTYIGQGTAEEEMEN